MKTTDPARMSRTDRLAELGELLAASYLRLAADKFKGNSKTTISRDQLDDVAVGEAQCGHPVEAHA